MPVTMKTIEIRSIKGTYKAPTIPESEFPALLGLKTLLDQRSILDCTDPNNITLAMCGPGAT